MLSRKLVIFDFDGVIADSFRICFETNRMFVPELTEEKYRQAFTGNIRDVGWRKHRTAADEAVFYTSYDPALLASQPFAGIPQAIRDLSKDYGLFIVSSSPAPIIREYLRRNDIDVFEQVLGHETHKYKDIKISMILKETQSQPADGVYVTDTLGDILEARKVGVEAIGVVWGFQSKETLSESTPVTVVEHPSALYESINAYFNVSR